MNFFDNINIQKKLLLILIFPFLIISNYIYQQLNVNIQLVTNSKNLEFMVLYNNQLSLLVHDLQLERGTTALYFGEKKTLHFHTLKKKRQETNKWLNWVESWIISVEPEQALKWENKINSIKKLLVELKSLRQSIDDNLINLSDMLNAYSNLINQIISQIKRINTKYQDQATFELNKVNQAIINLKEQRGLERAILAYVFAQNKFASSKLLYQFIAVQTLAKFHLQTFYSLANPEQKLMFNRIISNQEIERSERLKSLALKLSEKGNFNIDPRLWFQIQSNQIEKLKVIEDQLIEELLTQREQSTQDAQNSIKWFILVELLFIALIIGLTIILSRRLSNTIHQLALFARRLTSGDYSISENPLSQQDELGTLWRSMENLRQVSYKNQHLQQKNIESLNLVMHQLSTNTIDISNNLSKNSSNISELSSALITTMNEMSQSAELTANIAQNVKQLSYRSQESIQEGQQAVIKAQQGSQEIVSAMADTMFCINELLDNIENIGNLINMVDDLSRQSRLLAVNTTIEAAHIQHENEGFSVIAREIKVLSSRSQQTTAQVKIILKQILKALKQVLTAYEKGNAMAQTNQQVSVKAKQTIEGLSQVLQTTFESSHQISSASQQQQKGIQELAAIVNKINETSYQNSDNTYQFKQIIQSLKSLQFEIEQNR